MKRTLILAISIMTLLSGFNFADNFGHEGVNDESYTIEGMLQYALEDENLALKTYELISEEFNVTKPFTNIMRAEQTHIDLVEGLMEDYGLEITEVDAVSHITMPDTLQDAYAAGVQAEIDNIALYEAFLEQDVPDDVREVFEFLIRSSESHKAAFERNLGNTTTSNSSTVGGKFGRGRR